MKDTSTKKRPLKATLYELLELLAFLISLVFIFCLLADVHQFQRWVDWLLIIFTVIAANLLFCFLGNRKRKLLEKAGYGIKTLEKLGAKVETHGDYSIATLTLADRDVFVDSVEIMDCDEEGCWTVPFLRIRVKHTGKIPCVMEVCNGNRRHIEFFDRDAYMEWKKQQGEDLRDVPGKVKIHGIKVPTAYPEGLIPLMMERARHIFDDPGIAQLKGILRIEPEQVFFLQEGDLPEQEHLRNIVNLLVGLSEKTEKTF